MPLSEVQKRQTSANGVGSLSLAFLSLPSVNHLVVASVAGWRSSGLTFGTGCFTDNQPNTYARDQTQGSLTNAIAIGHVVVTTATGTFTVTGTPSATSDLALQIVEYSGNDTNQTNVANAGNGAIDASGTAIDTASFSVTLDDCLIVCAAVAHGNIDPTYTAGSGFTTTQEITDNTGGCEIFEETRAVTSIASYTGSVTSSIAASGASPIYIVAEAYAAVGAGSGAAGHPAMRRWGGIPGMTYTGRGGW